MYNTSAQFCPNDERNGQRNMFLSSVADLRKISISVHVGQACDVFQVAGCVEDIEQELETLVFVFVQHLKNATDILPH